MNYMPEVAKMLGVELGERFKIYAKGSDSNYDYYLTRNGIIIDKCGYACASNDVLCDILLGNYTIKRKPWKPSLDEEYYYVDETGYVCSDPWVDSALDFVFYKIGNCYKTKEDAEKDKDKWIEFYESDKVLEV